MVMLLQTAIADYRNSFIAKLVEEIGTDFEIVVGERYFEPSTQTSQYVRSLPCTKTIANNFFFGDRICLQYIPFLKVIKADVVVFELNPRLVMNWPILVLRKILGKKNVLWGHAWSRSGRKSKTESLRHAMRRLSNNLLFYTDKQLDEFRAVYPSYKGGLFVAPNSLYERAKIEAVNPIGKDIVYVGRLVSSKKVALLVEGFSLAIKTIPNDTLLHLVGDGPEMKAIQRLVHELSIEDRVIFHGHVSNWESLKNIYSRCVVSVSPGYVGLSITQSFAFGRPMIVADNENHSPEIEALVPDMNGVYFKAGNKNSLAGVIESYFKDCEIWKDKFDDVASDCSKRYSVERMVEGFKDAIAK